VVGGEERFACHCTRSSFVVGRSSGTTPTDQVALLISAIAATGKNGRCHRRIGAIHRRSTAAIFAASVVLPATASYNTGQKSLIDDVLHHGVRRIVAAGAEWRSPRSLGQSTVKAPSGAIGRRLYSSRAWVVAKMPLGQVAVVHKLPAHPCEFIESASISRASPME